MITKNSSGLYPWSKDLEASTDVRLREREGFAMLLGWLEKFVAGSGLSPGREACERFWKEQIRAKPREKWSRKGLRPTRLRTAENVRNHRLWREIPWSMFM